MSKHLYAAFFTGISGTSMGLFCIGDGIIAGADIGGLRYDGSIERRPDGSMEGIVKFSVPADTQLISGMKAAQPQVLTVPIKFEAGFDDGKRVTRIETPAGPVNAIFERLRELP